MSGPDVISLSKAATAASDAPSSQPATTPGGASPEPQPVSAVPPAATTKAALSARHVQAAKQRIASTMRRGLRALADFHPIAIKSQSLRIAIGVAFLALGAAIYLPQAIYTTSTEAVVNARIVTVSAPIEGHVVGAPPAEGAAVSADEPLIAIENETVDRGRLEELQTQRAKAENELASLTRLAESLNDQLTALNAQIAAYQKATIARLEIALRESNADATSLRATAREAQADFARKRQLHGNGYVSHAVIDKAEQSAVSSRANVERAEMATKRVSQELDAARKGVYVGQDRNDVPYSQQRGDELRVRHAEVEAQRSVLAAHLHQLDQQIAAEAARVGHLAKAEIRAPMEGVVWRPLVVAGSPVARDAELMTLIDCSHLYVTAALSGRRFDDLQHGTPATIHVLSSKAEYKGTVVDVRAMQRGVGEERFAAPLPALGAHQVLAIIQLDDASALASQKYCNVGRKAEVRFTDFSPPAVAEAARIAPSAPSPDHVQ